jgi:uncharacterized membrane protein
MRGLAILMAGLVLFIGAHVFVTMRDQRAALIGRIGEWPYKGSLALVSVIGLILIGYGFGEYRATDWIDVWHPPRWTYYITQFLMWPASIFVVAAYIRGNIWRTLKHPMLVGVKTWAVAHLISNGDLGSILLFGSFLLWAGYDRMTLKHRADAGAPTIPAGGHRNDIIALVVGTVLYVVLGLVFHPLVVGRAVFGRPAF